MSSATTSLVIK